MSNLIKEPLVITSLIIISLIGFFAIIAVTSQRGIGLSCNSAIAYIRMSRNLIDGNLSWQDAFLNYWVHFPPLFSLCLTAIHSFGGPDPLLSVRWFNASLFGLNILLVGLLIYWQTEAIWLAIMGSLWMIVKVDVLDIHSEAMSEPLLIFWTLLWLVFFLNFLKTRSVGSFLGFSIAAGLACITRFAGIPLILTGIVILLLDKKKSILNSFATATVFVFVSLFPMILWMIKNFLDGGRFINRVFAFHPTPILQGNYSWPINPIGTPSFSLLSFAVLFLLGWLIWKKRDLLAIENISNKRIYFLIIAILYIIIYFLTWYITITFLDAEAHEPRYLIPIEIIGMLFSLSCIKLLLSVTKSSNFLKVLFCGFLFIYLIGMNLMSMSQWFVERYNNGSGYEGIKWDKSEIIQEVKKISPDMMIYANDVKALYVRANCHAIPLQMTSKIDVLSLNGNSFCNFIMKRMKEDLKSKKGLIVYFSMKHLEKQKPTLNELKNEIPLKMLFKGQDGAIYGWDDRK